MEKPIPLSEPNIGLLKKVLDEYFKHISDDDICEDTISDMDHLILDAAIECLYGNNADEYIRFHHERAENN